MRAVNYSVAVVDIMLPKRDGLSLIRQVRREQISTPIVILSAKVSVDDRVAGLIKAGLSPLTVTADGCVSPKRAGELGHARPSPREAPLAGIAPMLEILEPHGERELSGPACSRPARRAAASRRAGGAALTKPDRKADWHS